MFGELLADFDLLMEANVTGFFRLLIELAKLFKLNTPLESKSAEHNLEFDCCWLSDNVL